jgi:hypothetical protein
MAFKTLKTKREATSLAMLGKRIAERRLVVGSVDVPRNEGTRRTPSSKFSWTKSPRQAASGDRYLVVLANFPRQIAKISWASLTCMNYRVR